MEDDTATTNNLLDARAAWALRQIDKAASLLWQSVSVSRRAAWATRVLQHVQSFAPTLPGLAELLSIGRDPQRHHEAHAAFDSMRDLTLAFEAGRAKLNVPYQYALYCCENAARVIYNCTDPVDPFDQDGGEWLARCLLEYAARLPTEKDVLAAWHALADPVA